ncbi:Na+/H+ antiporter NhaA [Streptomyces sp. NEAU-W12]|uniref:Na+/H+ antiporter NhaA n=1 Tax=Streptomyces sp. NEAU-W12 TaxID=2994668 RepID=UPI00224B3445|nr:Na+/H+ antiporter NhaA [Streptomyces sp. NEAU-W12]MCX2926291.1 Na+/H+ antiporter NhaA [Streptomyces sp. NEAU-W12]
MADRWPGRSPPVPSSVKVAGVDGVAHPARRLGWGTLPTDMHRRETLGAAVLGGIGFTVLLFITDLAFTDAALIGQDKVGILTAPADTATTSPPNEDRPGNRLEDRCWTSAHSPGPSPSP